MSKNEPSKRDNKAAWIIGGLAIVLVAIATYMTYGPRTHHVGAVAAPAAQILANNS